LLVSRAYLRAPHEVDDEHDDQDENDCAESYVHFRPYFLSPASVLVAALFGFVDSGLRSRPFGFGFFGRYLALRPRFGLLRFAFALQVVLARERASGFFDLAFEPFSDAFRAGFRSRVFVFVAHVESSG
jgi:hypothetical protein